MTFSCNKDQLVLKPLNKYTVCWIKSLLILLPLDEQFEKIQPYMFRMGNEEILGNVRKI